MTGGWGGGGGGWGVVPRNRDLGVLAGEGGGREAEGLEGGELHRVIMHDLPALDEDVARAELLAAGERLRARAPDLGAVVLECTNLPPYADALRRHLGLPVYDMVSAVNWLRAGLFSP